MDFEYSAKTQELQGRVRQFMDENVYPNEQAVRDELEANTQAGKRWTPLETINKQKEKAKAAGLWNLFLPVDSAHATRLRRCWPDESGICAAGRDHGPGAVGERGVQLLRARHRQHGNDRALR